MIEPPVRKQQSYAVVVGPREKRTMVSPALPRTHMNTFQGVSDRAPPRRDRYGLVFDRHVCRRKSGTPRRFVVFSLVMFLSLQPIYVALGADLQEEVPMIGLPPTNHSHDEPSRHIATMGQELATQNEVSDNAASVSTDTTVADSDTLDWPNSSSGDEGVVYEDSVIGESADSLSHDEEGNAHGDNKDAEESSASVEKEGDEQSTPTSDSDGAIGALGAVFTIGNHECTALADGALYCVEKTDSRGTPMWSDFGESRVLSRKDRDGDKEIYFIENGRTVQITHNTIDDFAPMYDVSTNRIVWNAMVNDRLQIMMHDRETGVTRQMTATPYNNSNPYLSGDTLVWQAWSESNWEIVMARNLARDTISLTELTKNSVHDMFPRVYQSFITWQSQTSASSWNIVVYDIERGSYEYIEKRGDERYENPRFALLFDARDEEGDIRLVGWDVGDKKEIPLAPLPRIPRDPLTPADETGDSVIPGMGSGVIKTGERKGADTDVTDPPDDDDVSSDDLNTVTEEDNVLTVASSTPPADPFVVVLTSASSTNSGRVFGAEHIGTLFPTSTEPILEEGAIIEPSSALR